MHLDQDGKIREAYHLNLRKSWQTGWGKRWDYLVIHWGTGKAESISAGDCPFVRSTKQVLRQAWRALIII